MNETALLTKSIQVNVGFYKMHEGHPKSTCIVCPLYSEILNHNFIFVTFWGKTKLKKHKFNRTKYTKSVEIIRGE